MGKSLVTGENLRSDSGGMSPVPEEEQLLGEGPTLWDVQQAAPGQHPPLQWLHGHQDGAHDCGLSEQSSVLLKCNCH